MKQPILDLAIIGGGPAALSAAIYAGRAGLKVKVFERKNLGGTLAEIDHISNYPGFVGQGSELGQSFRQQAEQFGADLEYGECTSIQSNGHQFKLVVDEEEYLARSALIATGSQPRELDFKLNKPTSYCALCDGELVKGKNVAIVGGANSAVQETLYLAKIARQVTIITRSNLKADQKLQTQLTAHSNISIRTGTVATPETLETFDHVFVYIGRCPASKFAENLGILNNEGYIITNASKEFAHSTIIQGLFAAGDVRDGAIRQVVTAAADGAAAAIEITKYLKSQM